MKWLSDSIRLDRQLTVKMKSCAAMILEVCNGQTDFLNRGQCLSYLSLTGYRQALHADVLCPAQLPGSVLFPLRHTFQMAKGDGNYSPQEFCFI